MRVEKISSSLLPRIDSAVKECVNLGQWMLFQSRSDRKNVFYLKAGEKVFGLDESGEVVGRIESTNLNIDKIFYFDDLPHPGSLSSNVNFRF